MLYFETIDEVKNINPFLSQFMIYENDSNSVDEIYSALVYLYANNMTDQLNFPFAFIKRESPDFSILCYDKKYSRGIEHTLSTLQDYKMAESELQKLPSGSKLEPDYYSPFIKLPKNEIKKGLKLSSEKLTGKGYTGDRPEIEWAEIIKNAIHKKTVLLNKTHFEKFSINELLIEGDSPVEFIVDLKIALTYLKPHIKEYQSSDYNIKYDKIHIISKNTFVFDVLSKNELIGFSKNELLA